MPRCFECKYFYDPPPSILASMPFCDKHGIRVFGKDKACDAFMKKIRRDYKGRLERSRS